MIKLASIVLILFWTSTINAEPKKNILLSAGSWPPFTGEHLKNFGTAAHVVSDAFMSQGVRVEYLFRPWKRAFIEAETGVVDGSILWRYTEERARSFYFSDSVSTIKIVFFHLKKFTFDWKSLEDLKGKRIGLVRSFKYSDAFDAILKTGLLEIEYVATQEQNLKKIAGNRIDITPIVLESGYETLKALFAPKEVLDFTHHAVPVAEQSLHLLLSKKKESNKQLMKLFNTGLKGLKKSGHLDSLLSPK